MQVESLRHMSLAGITFATRLDRCWLCMCVYLAHEEFLKFLLYSYSDTDVSILK